MNEFYSIYGNKKINQRNSVWTTTYFTPSLLATRLQGE